MPQFLTIVEASQRLPGRPHRNSVRRWMASGCCGIKLRSVRFGGKRLTTAAWCDEFISAVTDKTGGASIDHHTAEAQLDQMGVC